MEQDKLKLEQEKFIKKFSDYIYELKKKNNYLEIVFLCIGTDRLLGDAFGPLVGSRLEYLLKNYNLFNINIYGTLDKNICYTNILEYLENIKTNHPNAYIVVIDAALSKEENIGNIYVKNEETILAKGLSKKKIEIGDISIKAVVGKNYKLSKCNFIALQNISLNKIMNLSKIVADGIFEVIKYA